MVQTECKLLRAAVVLKLIDSTDIVLPGELVLQFQSYNRNAIHRQYHVDGVAVGGGVAELTCTAEDIRLIALHVNGVQFRLRLEEADLQLAAHILNAVAEDIQQALIGNSGLQAVVQLVRSLVTIVFGILRPFPGLGLGDKFAENIHIDALCHIVLTGVHPVALGILPVELGVATLRGDEEGFYIPFKSFLTFIH